MLVDLSNLPTPDLMLALPQLIVFGLAIVLLFLDAFLPRERHYGVLTGLSLIGYAAAAVSLWWQDGKNAATFLGLFRADGLTVFLSLIILVAAVLSVMTAASYVDRLEGRMPIGEFYVLLAFAVLGALLVAAAGDLIMLFVGIELSSLATYVLTAFARRRATSLEAALKYFLLGLFASAILIYGMAWIYGASGSTDLDRISIALAQAVDGTANVEASILLGLLLLIVGLGFKMAAVPFHFWTPDAYDGAPTPVTAYMSVIPKAAAFAATIRILVQGLPALSEEWLTIIAALALLTMAFGNIVAIAQRNVKRMLAYSSIAHTGYMLVGLAVYQVTEGFSTVDGFDGVTTLLFYMFAYVFMNIGAFAIVAWLQHRGQGMTLDDFSGLARTNPLAAAAMTVFMVSLMGVPPFLGFYAKYYIILSAIQNNTALGITLAVAIVVLSAISAFFYLRVVAVMYFSEPVHEFRKESTPLLNFGIGAMAVATIFLGFFSSDILALAERWSRALTVVAQITTGGG
jgi:NADH-quinone oxidoreductase subunit N